MGNFPKKLQEKLHKRTQENALRILNHKQGLVDFSSNDYLGFAYQKSIATKAAIVLAEYEEDRNGATGSRLLSGNNLLNLKLEDYLAAYYNSDSALVFNSGYDANIGVFSSIPQRGDIILYDELCHASIRDGIRMSHAKSYKFKHNDIEAIAMKLVSLREASKSTYDEIYVVTESVFSMDGDSPNLQALVAICQKQNVHLIVDEAHAVGVFEKGLLHKLGLETQVFMRIVTFGKAMGAHGAAVLGSESLKTFLINFCRSFVYTTALPPHTLATIWAAHKEINNSFGYEQIQALRQNICHFQSELVKKGLASYFCSSKSAIQVFMIEGNKKVKELSKKLEENGFDVRPILSPTVPKGKERLRFCLHSYNTKKEIEGVLQIIKSNL